MEVLRRRKDDEKSKKEQEQLEKEKLEKEKLEEGKLQHGKSNVGIDTSRKGIKKDDSLSQLLNEQNTQWEREKLDAEKDAKKERPTLHNIELPNLNPVAFGVYRAFHELSYPLPNDVMEDLEASGVPKKFQETYKVGFIENLMDVVSKLSRTFAPHEMQAAGIAVLKEWAEKKVPVLVFPYLRGEEICFISCRALLSQEERHELGIRRYIRLGDKIPFPYNSNLFDDLLDKERKGVHFLYPSRYRLNILSKEEDVLVVCEKGFEAIAIRDFNIEEEWLKLFQSVEPVLIVDQTDRKFPNWEQKVEEMAEQFKHHDMLMRLENLPDGLYVSDWFVKSNLGARTFKTEKPKEAKTLIEKLQDDS